VCSLVSSLCPRMRVGEYMCVVWGAGRGRGRW
jgi:hypothetical protein